MNHDYKYVLQQFNVYVKLLKIPSKAITRSASHRKHYVSAKRPNVQHTENSVTCGENHMNRLDIHALRGQRALFHFTK
jgi:hypothetical protein